jgi:hypothetical protein
VPPEVEWFANLTNAHARWAYESAVKDFMRFGGIQRPEEFRAVTRTHAIAWRDDMRKRLTKRGGIGCRHWPRRSTICPLIRQTKLLEEIRFVCRHRCARTGVIG